MRPPFPAVLSAGLLVGAIGAAGCTRAPEAAKPTTPANSAPRLARRFELVESSITDLQRALSSGRITSRALVAMYRARIAAYDTGGPKLNSVSVQSPQAADEASALDAERSADRVRGPLHGIPIIVKDNYETSNMQTAAGSRALAGYIPKRDAFVVTRLKKAGAIILAKANMDELGLGIAGQGSLYGQVRNPYALDRSPGGSSAGPAAAVAANLAAAALGSDTCGSIRMPAAHHALVGLRGTQGLMSRTGLVPLSHTQDMVAPIARTVADVAILLDAMVGHDPEDAQTAEAVGRSPRSYAAGLDADALKGTRIGLLTSLQGKGPEHQVVNAIIKKAAADMEARGATVVEIADDIDELLRPDRFKGFVVPAHEVKADLTAYLESLPSKPPATTIDQLLAAPPPALATFWLKTAQSLGARDSKEYTDALLRRNQLRQALHVAMARNDVDVLAFPTYRVPPETLKGEEVAESNNCMAASNSGLPSISVPAGWTDDELPVGIELLGRAWSEAQLLGIAYAFEQATHHRRAPKLTPALRRWRSGSRESRG
jgi:Asp-tRNA(Asn)/Glu-tRNA(Gln) amidotransferase A subunit family amidase